MAFDSVELLQKFCDFVKRLVREGALRAMFGEAILDVFRGKITAIVILGVC